MIDCPFCDKTYTHQNSLDCHILRKHPDKLDKKCPWCSKKLRNGQGLISHVSKMHRSKYLSLKRDTGLSGIGDLEKLVDEIEDVDVDSAYTSIN